MSDPVQRLRIEDVFRAAFSIRRALQSDVRSRVTAYYAAKHERERTGAKDVRHRLGLSREALEHRAYEHLDRAPQLRRSATKALVMHLADSVWTAAERHLFADASGKRQGLLRIGRWFDFHRLPGRARSHTTPRKWETFRLHGTLDGHRMAYTNEDGFFQPRRMRPVPPPRGSWWDHAGAFAIVFSGLADGELVLPVRLPAAPSNQPILDHHLGDPERWHKIDLVRRRDPNSPGGWRYEAHLMVLVQPYESPSTRARRDEAARTTGDRSAGIDVNVSNVTIASHVAGDDVRISRVARDAGQRAAARERVRRDRRRQRALDRSRRAANPGQYEFSPRQRKRAEARAAAGLPAVQVIPHGPRKSRSDGKPLQAFRKDLLTLRYRALRATQATAAAGESQARKARARTIAGELIACHGFRAVIEDSSIAAWSRAWGRSLAAFSPGTLLDAIRREAEAVSLRAGRVGGLVRASTTVTALSQHCLCGARVRKTLATRIHNCHACGLSGDRDAVSALLGSFVVFENSAVASSATVDYSHARTAVASATSILKQTMSWSSHGRQDAPFESNAASTPGGPFAEDKERTSEVRAARRNAGTALRATPDEIGACRTTSERARMRTSLKRRGGMLPLLRDSS